MDRKEKWSSLYVLKLKITWIKSKKLKLVSFWTEKWETAGNLIEGTLIDKWDVEGEEEKQWRRVLADKEEIRRVFQEQQAAIFPSIGFKLSILGLRSGVKPENPVSNYSRHLPIPSNMNNKNIYAT